MKIVIATGGTGGHLFPAIKVALKLRALGHDILFLGSFPQGLDELQRTRFPFENLDAHGLRFNGVKETFSAASAMGKAFFRSIRSLKRFHPEVVAGFGGYGAFPVVAGAVFLRLPALIHEQNVVPGRANAILAKFVPKIAVSFKQSARFFPSAKIVLTGCPTHAVKKPLSREQILKELNLDLNKRTILVFGGSQGSRKINSVFFQTAKLLIKEMDFQVIHLCGQSDLGALKDDYASSGLKVCLFDFFKEMEKVYTAADLVISRAGAVTVSEIALFALPAILIPYPHAGGHQKENAMVLSDAGTARIIEESELNEIKLKNELLNMLNNPASFREREEKVKGITIPDAAQRISEEVLALAR